MFGIRLSFAATAVTLLMLASSPSARLVELEIENLSPAGGTYLTPIWVGFHDGSFDSYDGGSPASAELERLAEDGNNAPISALFVGGGAGRVDGSVGAGPIAPGATVSEVFDVDVTGVNRYFSYGSMVLLSNDYFIANGNPTAHDLSSLDGGGSISFMITVVNDAGTEVNDFTTSAGNGLFPGAGMGQGGPNLGADEGGVIVNVADAYADFLNVPGGFDLSALDFNAYPSGIARVTLSAVPEPAAGLLLLSALAVFAARRATI